MYGVLQCLRPLPTLHALVQSRHTRRVQLCYEGVVRRRTGREGRRQPHLHGFCLALCLPGLPLLLLRRLLLLDGRAEALPPFLGAPLQRQLQTLPLPAQPYTPSGQPLSADFNWRAQPGGARGCSRHSVRAAQVVTQLLQACQ